MHRYFFVCSTILMGLWFFSFELLVWEEVQKEHLLLVGSMCLLLAIMPALARSMIRMCAFWYRMYWILHPRRWPTEKRARKRLAYIQALHREAIWMHHWLDEHKAEYPLMSPWEKKMFDFRKSKYICSCEHLEGMIVGSRTFLREYFIDIPDIDLPKITV